MDVSTDTKYLLATATTKGVLVFDISNGDKLAEIHVPGIMTHKVEFSYSNKQFAVVFEDQNSESILRIYNLKDALAWGNKEGSP